MKVSIRRIVQDMNNIRSFWEGKGNGAIFDNISIALGVLARRDFDEDDKGRMMDIVASGIKVLREKCYEN